MISKLEADKLVKKHDTFYRKDLVVDGVNIFIYNYLLSDKEAFNDGIGKELRGLTITHENGKENVFLSCPKFFNINETKENEVQNLKTKTIKKVHAKLDGSLIQPIQLNGNIIMKTKQSFTNEQAILAQQILESSAELQYFIMDCWDNNFYPLFELTGPSNIVVLNYQEDNLNLIAVRDHNGEFIDVDKFNYKYTATSYIKTLDELVDEAIHKTGIEGYVIKFTDGVVVKIKTLDYIEKHRLNDESNSYKILLKRILEETVDDILSVVPVEKRDKIRQIDKIVSDYIIHYIKQITDIVSKGDNNNRASFVKNNITHIYFSVIMSGMKGHDIKEKLIEYILKKYNREEKAKQFILSL